MYIDVICHSVVNQRGKGWSWRRKQVRESALEGGALISRQGPMGVIPYLSVTEGRIHTPTG